MSASQPIDYGALEKELLGKIEADKRYWRENDAKFRAVNQKVASYHEFKEIVNAAHLKPLDKNECVQNISSKYSIWNSLVTKGEMHHKTLEQTKPPTLENNLPETSVEFLKTWKNLNNEGKYALLKKYEKNHLQRIFALEIPMGILGDVLQVMLTFSLCQTELPVIIQVLEELSQSKRFNLTLQFLSSTEQENCVQLFNKLEDIFKNFSNDVIGHEISVTVIEDLKEKYNVQKVTSKFKSEV